MHGKSEDRVRTEFRIRTEMVDDFKDNFIAKYRTLEKGQEDRDPGLQCDYCDVTNQARDSQAHCLCRSQVRSGPDFPGGSDLVTYFQRVLKARAEREEKERKMRRIKILVPGDFYL